MLGLYPDGLAVDVLLVVGSQWVGLREEVQVDAAAHRLIALGIQVQPVVLEKEALLHGRRVLRVAHGLVEVNHAVEHFRGANPLVQRTAAVFVVGAEVGAVLEGSDGAAKDIDALLMGFADDLLVDVDDALRRLHSVTRIAQVVDRLEQDDPLHALLPQQVALVAVHGSRAKASTEHAVAADAHVQHGHLVGRLVGQQAARQHVGPAVLLVSGRAATVGDGVAQNGHRSGLLGGLHLKGQDVVPVLRLRGAAEVGGVAGLQVRRGARAGMPADAGRRRVAIVDGDGHVLAVGDVERHGVRRGRAACRHRHRWATAEGEAHHR